MTRIVLLILLTASLGLTDLHAQESKTIFDSIDQYCKAVETDSTIKNFSPSHDKLRDSGFADSDLICYYRNDTIFKITAYYLHVGINSFEYYYRNGCLIFARLTKRHLNYDSGVSKKEYYFKDARLIKAAPVLNKSSKDDKNTGKYILEDAERLRKFLTSERK